MLKTIEFKVCSDSLPPDDNTLIIAKYKDNKEIITTGRSLNGNLRRFLPDYLNNTVWKFK